MNRNHDNGYHTKQRAAVLDYFKRHPHIHMTAQSLSDALAAEGSGYAEILAHYYTGTALALAEDFL